MSTDYRAALEQGGGTLAGALRVLEAADPPRPEPPPPDWHPSTSGFIGPAPPPGAGTLQRLREVATVYPAEVLAVLWPLLAARVAGVVERIVAERLREAGHGGTSRNGTNGTALRIAAPPNGG